LAPRWSERPIIRERTSYRIVDIASGYPALRSLQHSLPQPKSMFREQVLGPDLYLNATAVPEEQDAAQPSLTV
jgi:hypothetical protein